MFDYEKQAQDFLDKANAKIEINYVGYMINENWDEKHKRNVYDVTITTPKGKMNLRYWNNIINSNLSHMDKEEYAKKYFKCQYFYLTEYEKRKVLKALKEAKEKKPGAYEILACLQKYEVGTMDDFMADYGYKIKSARDITRFLNLYNACQEEYADVCRIFTREQIEELWEIS